MRLIHDASRPAGHALNDFASTNRFKYQSIQDATDLVTRGCWFAKLDLANAYRSVKIHQSNFKATGLKWRFANDTSDTFLIDERLSFGASKSPEIFNILTQAVRAIMAHKGYKTIVCYLDDFLIVAQTYDECIHTLNVLLRLLRQLGFHINYNKLEGPSRNLTFLGVVLDSINMTLSIPQSKLTECDEIMNQIIVKSKVNKREIQCLVGKLNWLSHLIYGGRSHMRRLIDRCNALRKPWHRTNVTIEMKKDIEWWLSFMRIFNGTTQIVENRSVTSLSIDSCKVAGGAFYHGDFVYAPWTYKTSSSLPINYLEILALEPAAMRWAPYWRNKKVYVHCDNITACSLINKLSCKNPTVMESLRRVFWLSAVYNFRLQAIYYPGPQNILADRVSRAHEPGGLHKLYEAMANAGYF